MVGVEGQRTTTTREFSKSHEKKKLCTFTTVVSFSMRCAIVNTKQRFFEFEEILTEYFVLALHLSKASVRRMGMYNEEPQSGPNSANHENHQKMKGEI